MAKITLLEVVQDILSDADSDDVNSISDTVESDQCARIVRDKYLEICDIHDIEYIKTISPLNATTSSTPTVMTRPSGFHTIEFVKYDKRAAVGNAQNFEYVYYMEVDAFLERVQGFSTDDDTVGTQTLNSGLVMPYKNNQARKYYTVMDTNSDELVFDSYNVGLETNLQQSKSLVYGSQRPTLSLSDSSTFDIPEHLETLVKREARAMFFDLYKDGITAEIDRSRRRAEVRAQRKRNIIKNTDNDNRPDYGRK
jgi:hypothetical protein